MKCSEGCYSGGARWECRMNGLKSWGNVNRRNGCGKEVVGQPLCLERRYELGWGDRDVDAVCPWGMVWLSWFWKYVLEFNTNDEELVSFLTFLCWEEEWEPALVWDLAKDHAIKVGLRGKIRLAKVTSLFLTFTALASALSSPPTMTK